MTTAPSGGASPRAALAYRDFRLYQVARFLATIAVQFQSVAVGWQVYEITGRALDLGYVGLAQFAPAFVLSFVTGHVADRFDRRRVLQIAFGGLLVCSALLFVLARAHAGVLPVYGVLVLFGTVRAFQGPAAQALMPELVPREHFSNAVAWSSTTWQVATIVGPGLGGLIYGAAQSAAAVYAVSGVLTFAAFLMLSAMEVRSQRLEKKSMSMESLLAGLQYVFRKKIVLGSISLDLFAVLLGGAVALLPVYARDILHVGSFGLGALRSSFALGAAVTALALAFRPLARHAGPIMLLCVGLFGAATVVFGISHNFVLSLVALTVAGAADMVSVVVRSTLVQIATPSEMRGRVSAVNLVFVGASNELGEFESGLTAAWLGAVPAVVLGGIGTCVVVAIWALAFPALRRVDRLEDAHDEGTPAP